MSYFLTIVALILFEGTTDDHHICSTLVASLSSAAVVVVCLFCGSGYLSHLHAWDQGGPSRGLVYKRGEILILLSTTC